MQDSTHAEDVQPLLTTRDSEEGGGPPDGQYFENVELLQGQVVLTPRKDDQEEEKNGPENPQDSSPEEISTSSSTSKFALLGYTLLLLASSVGNSIFFKKMTNHLPNYPLFLNFLTTLVYIPIFFSIVFYHTYVTGKITPEMRQFPQRKILVMGLLDSASGLFMIFGGIYTTGSRQNLLTQAVIPVTMLLSILLLRVSYSKFQYIGACVIVVGLLVMLLPSILFPPPASGGTSSTTKDDLLFNIIFLLSVVPMGLSGVYKEIAFTEDLEVNFLQAWVAWWQLLFTIVLAPVNALRILKDQSVPLKEIPDAIGHGALCLVGTNSQRGDACHNAWIPVLLYLTFNCLYNISIMLMIKHGSAALLYVASTLRLPLVQIAFSLAIINSPPDPFHWYSILSTVVIIAGLSVYRSSSSQPALDEEQDVYVVPGALEAAPIPLVRKRHPVVLARHPQVIRSGFYAKLGIRDSPQSDRFQQSFRQSV